MVTAGAVKSTDPVQKPDDRKAIPEWGQTLTGRIDALERKVDQGFAGINAKLDKLSGTPQQTDTGQETGADSWQRFYNQ